MTPLGRLIRDWYATLAAGDVEGALAKLDPDVEWIEAESSPYGGPEPIRGRDAVRDAIFIPLGRDWERIAVEPRELVELPAGVLALVRYRGVRRGTGARLDAQAAHIWDVQNDRITRYHGLADTYALRAAVGSPTERNRRLAREEFDVWSTGDVEKLDDLVADDVIHHDPHDPYAADGLEGLKASIRATRERFRDFEIAVLDQVAEGDKVATRWRATMREASMTGITIERFADGKVVESWRAMDRLGLLRDLGLLPGVKAEE